MLRVRMSRAPARGTDGAVLAEFDKYKDAARYSLSLRATAGGAPDREMQFLQPSQPAAANPTRRASGKFADKADIAA